MEKNSWMNREDEVALLDAELRELDADNAAEAAEEIDLLVRCVSATRQWGA
jgi:hypothetical protein